MRSVVLVTGMSGSGKSTVLVELKRRGHRVTDTDDPSWIVEAHTAGGLEAVWDLTKINALIDGHRTGWLFIAGCVVNQGVVYDRVDAVVLLSAPVDVILDRVADRQPFRIHGGRPDEDCQRPRGLRAAAACGRGSRDGDHGALSEVVAALEQVASEAGHQYLLRSRGADRI